MLQASALDGGRGCRRLPQSPSSPQTRHLLATELVPEAAREHADLTAVMGIVLQQIRQHIDRPARHPLYAGLPHGQGGFEQACEIIG